MSASTKFFLLAALLTVAWTHDAHADKKTVCTITVNSPDEKETFRRSLPEDDPSLPPGLDPSRCRLSRSRPTRCAMCATWCSRFSNR